ncbi:importin beta-like SAD2 [Iris pallida]|uniref:Importin beta-like SAD2 n=1 Tax=Iris pallida TaxID=29817 RepID=A0AAX6DH08_IRIPA|nr:importin beta-like SAD2 [Iris pallida]
MIELFAKNNNNQFLVIGRARVGRRRRGGGWPQPDGSWPSGTGQTRLLPAVPKHWSVLF